MQPLCSDCKADVPQRETRNELRDPLPRFCRCVTVGRVSVYAHIDACIVAGVVPMVLEMRLSWQLQQVKKKAHVLVQRDVSQLVEKPDRRVEVFEPEQFIERQDLHITRSCPHTTHVPVTLNERAKVGLDIIVADVRGLAKRETRGFRQKIETALDGRWFYWN